MNFDLQQITTGALSEIESFLSSGQGQQLIDTGAGLIEKQGDTNYIRAVLTAKALEETTGARPTVTTIENGRYLVSWNGEELVKAQAFFKDNTVKAINPNGEPAPVVVDFYPVVKPMVMTYGAPVLVGSALGLFALGYFSGRK